MKLWTAPTGKVIEGHVLDVNRKQFERKLREYDNQLYVKWNPRKCRGYGCYEVRRRPNEKSRISYGTYQGVTFTELKYIENDFSSHIMDVPYLNYAILVKLQKIDTWKNKNWVADMEYEEAKYQAEQEEKQRKELLYNMMQYKSAFRDFKALVLSGENPHHLAKFWDQNIPR